MAKLQLILNDVVLDEFLVGQTRVSIGRRSQNDIKLDSLAVSGEHARIERVGSNFFIQDCESTNGTLVNGKKVRQKTVLHDGDQIGIAKYVMRFLLTPAHEFPPTVFMPETLPDEIDDAPVPDAVINILGGPHAGKKLQLTREMTTLGKSGQQVLVILRRKTGYFLTQTEGTTPLRINGRHIETWPHLLQPGDKLKLLGADVRFDYLGRS